MEETDPAQCGALESCLWELKVSAHDCHMTIMTSQQTLQNHYHPDVSNLISCLLDPENRSKNTDLQYYLDKDRSDVRFFNS